MTQESTAESTELGKLLLRIGIALLHAGTGSSKTSVILLRFANNYGYDAHLDLATKTLSLSLHRQNEDHILFTGSRGMNSMAGINFSTLASITSLSWDALEKALTIDQTKEAFEKIMKEPAYPRWLVLLLVGAASAAFCFTFGGDAAQMLITFVSSLSAMWLKQELIRQRFNPFLVTFICTSIAATIIACIEASGLYIKPVVAFTTCSLFLIPGVPLITSIIDLLDGYILNGIERGFASLMHAFAIAAGLAFVLFVFQLI